jgi:hypothetical protein
MNIKSPIRAAAIQPAIQEIISGGTVNPELWTYGVLTPDGTGAVNENIGGVTSGGVATSTDYTVEISWVNLTGRADVNIGGEVVSTDSVSLTNDTGSKTQVKNSGGNTRLLVRDKFGGLTADSITISVKEVL